MATLGSLADRVLAFYSAWIDTVGAALSRLLAKDFISESVYIQPLDYFFRLFQFGKGALWSWPQWNGGKGLPISTTICMTLNVEDAKHNGRKFYGVLAKGSYDKTRIGKDFPSELLDSWTDCGKILVKPINGWQLSVSGNMARILYFLPHLIQTIARTKGEDGRTLLHRLGRRRNQFRPNRCGEDRTQSQDGIFQEDNPMPRKTWLPGRPKRSTVGMTWLPARPRRSSTAISPTFKAEVEEEGQGTGGNRPEAQVRQTEAQEAQVQLHHRRGHQMARQQAVLHRHLRLPWSHGHFADLRVEIRPDGVRRQSAFQRLLHAAQRQMGGLHSRPPLDECLETIRDDYWFQLT